MRGLSLQREAGDGLCRILATIDQRHFLAGRIRPHRRAMIWRDFDWRIGKRQTMAPVKVYKSPWAAPEFSHGC